jgi:SOS-response transcriptional repressor LexA
MNRKSGAARSLSAQGFTEKQGQYLAFIYTYSHMFRRPPAETDMQRHFQVSPPSVHQMIVTLERNGLIRRQPGVPRSIQILVAPEDLPILDGSKSTSQNHCDEVLVQRPVWRKRRFYRWLVTSGLVPSTDTSRSQWHVSNVPKANVPLAACSHEERK